MTLYYVGSVQYAAVAQFAVTHAYSVGDIVRQLATPTVGNERCFRCTTAGTSGATEAAWAVNVNGNTTQGTAVFINDTGLSWLKPLANLLSSLNNTFIFPVAGDTFYVAHDHNASLAAGWDALTGTTALSNPIKIICVNALGSVPPVSADLRFTAVESTTGNGSITMRVVGSYYFSGITFNCGTGANAPTFTVHSSSSIGNVTFDRCNLNILATGASVLLLGSFTEGVTILRNTGITLSATTQRIKLTGRLEWKNSTGLSGTMPTTLFTSDGNSVALAKFEGVDLSAIASGSTLVANWTTTGLASFINCKLAAGVILSAPQTVYGARIDLINSDSGATGYRQESSQYGGNLTTETTFTMVGGASDGVQGISWKVVTNANDQRFAPFECFQIAHWNNTTGAVVTATVEIESAATLTNNDVWIECQVLDNAGFPISDVFTTQPDVLAGSTNLTASGATWNGGLGSAVTQKLVLTFTPQIKGLVRCTVYVGKASQTVYINPQLTLT